SAQGISLTQTGRTFHAYATQLLELSSRAEEAVEQVHGLARGELDVGASSVPGHYILPRSLVRFKQCAPGVRISLRVGNSQEIRQGVHDGQFELGIIGEKVRDERLTFEAILSDQLVAVMRPDHALGDRSSLSLDDLARCSLIMRE